MGIILICHFRMFKFVFRIHTHLSVKHIVHILDDFMFVGPPNSPICQNNFDKFLAVCANLGVLIKPEKTEHATPIITLLGLELDSLHMVWAAGPPLCVPFWRFVPAQTCNNE